MSKTFTVEFTVADVWVDDGFDLNDENAQDWIEQRLGWVYPGEVSAKVTNKQNNGKTEHDITDKD